MNATTIRVVMPSIGPELRKKLAIHLDGSNEVKWRTPVILQLHQVRLAEQGRTAEKARLQQAKLIKSSRLLPQLERLRATMNALPEDAQEFLADRSLEVESFARICEDVAAAVREFSTSRPASWVAHSGNVFLAQPPPRGRGRPAKHGLDEHIVNGFKHIYESFRKRPERHSFSKFITDVQRAISKDAGLHMPVLAKIADRHKPLPRPR